MKPDLVPTEMVAATALRNGLLDFLASSGPAPKLKKFLLDNADPARMLEVTAAE
jgi:hypothetical protein